MKEEPRNEPPSSSSKRKLEEEPAEDKEILDKLRASHQQVIKQQKTQMRRKVDCCKRVMKLLREYGIERKPDDPTTNAYRGKITWTWDISGENIILFVNIAEKIDTNDRSCSVLYRNKEDYSTIDQAVIRIAAFTKLIAPLKK